MKFAKGCPFYKESCKFTECALFIPEKHTENEGKCAITVTAENLMKEERTKPFRKD